MRYSLFSNVCHTKIYPGILNISLGISIAHQSIDIAKLSSLYNAHLKNYWMKKTLQVGLELVYFNTHHQWAAAVLPLTQKSNTITMCP